MLFWQNMIMKFIKNMKIVNNILDEIKINTGQLYIK